jgi:tRNA nucleotidyltransferase (CCA-adding enzyme)
MKQFAVFSVGGAVRDAMLGLRVSDRDYVVVGATPDEMLAQGFKPVGADFPVFLHPDTHEEYALARTERKTAPGYTGFVFHTSPEVTLEEDLRRRDLTINAMALDDKNTLRDPYGGERDLRAGVLRHVSDAFLEDPVRILRIARFAARFAAPHTTKDFQIADETLALMRGMVANGEVGHLVSERVWQEISRGLMETRPSRMFDVLRACGALERIAPEIDRLFGVPQSATSHPEIDTGVHVMMVLDYAAKINVSLPVRFACLAHDLGKGTTPTEYLPRHPGHELASVALTQALCERLRVPTDCRELAVTVAHWHGEVHAAMELDAAKLLALLDGCDALRRPTRFDDVLSACACDHHGRLQFEGTPYPAADFLKRALVRLQKIDYATIAREHAKNVASAIEYNKFRTLEQFITEEKSS